MTARDDRELLDAVRALTAGPTLPQPGNARTDAGVRVCWETGIRSHPHDEDTYDAYRVYQGEDLVGEIGYRGLLAVDVPELRYGLYKPETTQGRGLMGAAFPQALRQMAEAGATAVVAQVGTWNTRSTRLVQRHGFTRISDADPDYPVWGRRLR